MIYKEDLLEMKQVALEEKARIEAEISVFDKLIARELEKEANEHPIEESVEEVADEQESY